MGKTLNIPADYMPWIGWHDYHYEKQLKFIMAQRSFWEVVFKAGNGAGKTHILYWCLIGYALGCHPLQAEGLFPGPPISIKVLLNDFEHGLDKVFSETCLTEQSMPDGKVLGPMLPMSSVEKLWSRDDRSVTFKNKSVIFFQTSEQKKRHHSGTNFDILACDEEAEKSHYDESKRGLRTAKGGGRILHSFTPPFDEESKNKGPTWTKFDIIDPFKAGTDNDVYVVEACMKDNPAITEDFIKRFSKGKTEQQLRIQLYGEYPTWGKLVLTSFEPYLWDAKEKTGNLLPYDLDVPWYDGDVLFEMSVDWHGSKAPAVIWSFEYLGGPNKGDVVVFDEISPTEGKNLTILDTSVAIRQHEGHRNVKIRRFCDPKMADKNNALITGFTPKKEFQNCGIRFTDGWNREPYTSYSIIEDFLRGKGKGNLEHPRLFIKEDCKTLIHNMQNHYNVVKPDGSSIPDTQFSDYCSSLRYIMQNKSRKHKKKLSQNIVSNRTMPLTSYGGNDFAPYMNKGIDLSRLLERR